MQKIANLLILLLLLIRSDFQMFNHMFLAKRGSINDYVLESASFTKKNQTFIFLAIFVEKSQAGH